MDFHEVRFPASVSVGSSGGPERRTDIVTLSNGFEERNAPWAQARRRYDAGVGMRSLDDLAAVIGFFEARAGQLYGFRWKDWADFKSCLPSEKVQNSDQVLGVGDDRRQAFQLVKAYRSGVGEQIRDIRKPVADTVLVAVSGDAQVIGTDFDVDYATGMVTFAAPPPDGAVVTAGFEFDVPVRFDTDRISVSAGGFSAGEIPSVPVVEVRV